MTLHGDLLNQARGLATSDPRRPKQANLRRSVSSAYYGLFHLLVEDGSKLASRSPANSPARHLVARKFEHGAMLKVSRAVVSGQAEWMRNSGLTFSADLRYVADAFVSLQEERHGADYDTGARLTRASTIEAVERAAAAFAAWQHTRGSEAARYYLLAMLVGPPR